MADYINYIIYDVREDQLDSIECIERECFSLPWTREQLEHQLTDDTHVFLAAECSSTVAGYVGMSYVLDEGYISNVAVSTEYRRHGIADALINKLCERAEKLDLSFVTLEVRKSNDPAIALYSKHGFVPVGERKNYYEQPRENALLMTKYMK